LTSAFLFEVYLSRAMVFRETSSNMYTPLAYHVSRFLAHTPFVIVEMLVLSLMVNYISNVNKDPNYFIGYYYIVLLSVRFIAISYVYMIGALVGNPGLGNTLVFVSFSVNFASSGFLYPTSSIGWWWRWFTYGGNFVTWALRFIAPLAIRDQVYVCSPNPDDLQLTSYDPATYDLCPVQPGLPPGLKCYIQCGKDLLDLYGVEYTDKWIGLSVLIMWSFFIVYFTIGLLAIKYIQHIKR